MEWYFYIIKNKNCSYAGVSTNPQKRLRQHNKEISGGAKYTTSKSSDWTHICVISGFSKIESLQFEWAVKHCYPLSAKGIQNRIKKLFIILNKEKWTSKSPFAHTVPLNIEWHNENFKDVKNITPDYITEIYL